MCVFTLTNGAYPLGDVDHRDGDGLNNVPSNLRCVTRSLNMQNKRRYKNNTSGVCGVTWYKPRGLWVATGTASGIKKTLGYFSDKFEALSARKRWELTHNFTARHGTTGASQ